MKTIQNGGSELWLNQHEIIWRLFKGLNNVDCSVNKTKSPLGGQ